MADRTAISWTDHTFNPWIGCQNVSPGCDNCYAEALTKRFGWSGWGPESERKRTSAAYWKRPLGWNKRAKKRGARELVFCASLADVFDNQAPEEALEDLWELIRNTPNLDWQLLTKRPQNIEAMLPPDWGEGYLNVWLGISAEDQQEYNRRWPLLAATPTVVRFISYEPALGPLTLADQGELPDWLIWGGESGPGARSLAPAWIREITKECTAGGVAVFGKQWGNYRNNPLTVEDSMTTVEAEREDPRENGMGGALLEGRLWREFPGGDRNRPYVKGPAA